MTDAYDPGLDPAPTASPLSLPGMLVKAFLGQGVGRVCYSIDGGSDQCAYFDNQRLYGKKALGGKRLQIDAAKQSLLRDLMDYLNDGFWEIQSWHSTTGTVTGEMTIDFETRETKGYFDWVIYEFLEQEVSYGPVRITADMPIRILLLRNLKGAHFVMGEGVRQELLRAGLTRLSRTIRLDGQGRGRQAYENAARELGIHPFCLRTIDDWLERQALLSLMVVLDRKDARRRKEPTTLIAHLDLEAKNIAWELAWWMDDLPQMSLKIPTQGKIILRTDPEQAVVEEQVRRVMMDITGSADPNVSPRKPGPAAVIWGGQIVAMPERGIEEITKEMGSRVWLRSCAAIWGSGVLGKYWAAPELVGATGPRRKLLWGAALRDPVDDLLNKGNDWVPEQVFEALHPFKHPKERAVDLRMDVMLDLNARVAMVIPTVWDPSGPGVGRIEILGGAVLLPIVSRPELRITTGMGPSVEQ